MWRAIVNFFKAINHGLTGIEDYLDIRVRTGQWVGDVEHVSQDTNKGSFVLFHRFWRSRIVRITILLSWHLWHQLLTIAAFEKTVKLTKDAFFLAKRSYVEIIIALQLSYLSIVILYNLFINAPLISFISFFPILFFNGLLLSVLYYILRENKTEEKMSIKEALGLSLQQFTQISTLITIYFICGLVLVSAFFIIATFYSFFFTALRIAWENSFVYWVIIAPLFFLLLAILFGLAIISTQGFFVILFEKKHIFYAFRKATKMTTIYFRWFNFFYLLLIFTFLHISYWVSLIFFPFGFITAVFFFFQMFFLLSFLLRREFAHKQLSVSEHISNDNRTVFSSLLIFGFATYFAVTILSIKNHDVIVYTIGQIQKALFISQQLRPYTNDQYGYTIDYPQQWSIHEEKDNSIAMYDNQTNTSMGGVIAAIKVLPFSQTDFDKLYKARSGLISYNTLDKNTTIKIDNHVVDYKYPAVKYTYLKSGDPLTEYSINYLIHKDDLMYLISFITYDKELQGENTYIFQAMINSIRFNY